MRSLKCNITKLLSAVATMVSVALMVMLMSSSVSAKSIDADMSEYGYGKYVVIARGVGYDGVYDEDSVTFYYLPVYADVVDSGDGEGQALDLTYSADNGEEDREGYVAKIEIKIYDENGNELKPLSPITVYPPQTEVPLPFDEYDFPSGRYKIEVTAYDADDKALYIPYTVYVTYNAEEDIIVPDTGSFSQVLNISRADYLITGLIAFATVAIPGIFIVGKKNGKTHKKSRKH